MSIDTGVERVDSVQVSIDTSVKMSSRASTNAASSKSSKSRPPATCLVGGRLDPKVRPTGRVVLGIYTCVWGTKLRNVVCHTCGDQSRPEISWGLHV